MERTATPTPKRNAPKLSVEPTPQGPELDEILGRASVKDRTSVYRHLAAADADVDAGRRGKLWRRLVTKLGQLAPLPVQTQGLDATGQHATLFYCPDGKYRMQVFTIEDRRDGVLQVYLPNVLAQAVTEKVLKKKGEGYVLAADPAQPLAVFTFDATDTPDPAKHVKTLIGWNRKALRVTLPSAEADSPQVRATEQLCAIAARAWQTPAPK